MNPAEAIEYSPPNTLPILFNNSGVNDWYSVLSD